MSVIGHQVNPRVPQAHSSIKVSRGIVNQSLGIWTFIVPDRSPGTCVQGKSMIGGGDQHQPIYNYRGNFEPVRIIRVKNPLGAKVIHIVYVDFIKAAVTASCVVAVVGRPIGTGRLNDKMLGKDVDYRGNRG